MVSDDFKTLFLFDEYFSKSQKLRRGTDTRSSGRVFCSSKSRKLCHGTDTRSPEQ